MVIAIVVAVVFIQQALRKIPIQYAQRLAGKNPVILINTLTIKSKCKEVLFRLSLLYRLLSLQEQLHPSLDQIVSQTRSLGSLIIRNQLE